ncbi:hypothetical protein BpHYR1_047113 [Brachionus plicatilis]|uniref:Uncharacterized protein n=1 Tax=Brachionus plicatilis TaxID=10195 RepID=A0A3M7Q0Z4_BRAPC|nr:hypothetical protein BpHYR1_047113 [Brachionus plicatilis]
MGVAIFWLRAVVVFLTIVQIDYLFVFVQLGQISFDKSFNIDFFATVAKTCEILFDEECADYFAVFVEISGIRLTSENCACQCKSIQRVETIGTVAHVVQFAFAAWFICVECCADGVLMTKNVLKREQNKSILYFFYKKLTL